ncbi:unnamed protein product [Angiostrongylus costaricensis]|uniref:receptor protein-tyrosine kinase n=1 Tax=Angiostrongylus costaricensis TaxID=334426 RepID=A0A158PHS2_ANGCS|nr:unnamed protein product [Angiostrongylus costaricensis]
MDGIKKDEVSWAVEPRQETGNVLFKISLYKDKLFVGEAQTVVTTLTKLSLPAELLQSWPSAQHFDVNIEGITAWMSFNVSKTGLQAPLKPPTAPTNVRLYATQQKTVDGARAIISLFWSPPEDWNGAPFQYIINCTKDDGTLQGGPVASTITHISFEVKSGKVECSVAAANEPNNVGEFTPKISIDSSELKPLVRLFAIDSTNALIAITNVTQDEPAKKEKRQISQVNRMEYQAIAFIANDLFAVRTEPDSLQPVLVQIDTNDIDNIVHKVSIGGDVTRVDTMTSDWVGNRLLLVSGQALYQLPLDAFLTTSLLTPRKLIELSTGATDAKQLTFDPFKNTAYLLTRNGSLFMLNLSRNHVKNMALVAHCLASQTVTWMMTEKGLKAMSAFAIADKLFIFVTSSEMLIYGRETVVPIPIAYPPLRQILAVSQSSQPYPERACFALPSSAGIQFTMVNEGKTGAYLEVSKPPPPNICHGVSLPQTHYEVYFNRKNSDKVKHIRSYTEKIHVENGILDKETDYEVTVAWLNRYSEASGTSDPKPFRTGFGYPSAPRSLQAVAITPDTVYLYWNLPATLNAPIAEIKYKKNMQDLIRHTLRDCYKKASCCPIFLFWGLNLNKLPRTVIFLPRAPAAFQISQQASGLTSPSSIAVQEYANGAFSTTTSDSASCLASPYAEAISQEASARTKDIPGTLRPDNVSGSSLLLRWNSLQAEQPPSIIAVQYKETGGTILINGLLSATSYDYRFVAVYSGTFSVENGVIAFKEFYYQGIQHAKTKGKLLLCGHLLMLTCLMRRRSAGVPTAPQQVDARMDDEGWIVSWKEPASDGGSPITSYAVEMRQNRSSEWEIAERGLDGWKLWWRPAKNSRKSWEFRVRAANTEGFGAYGYSNDTVGRVRARANELKKERNHDENCITLEKIAGLNHAPSQPMPPDMINEIKNLPHVRSDFVRLEKKLGTGSFGEVWEGVATQLPMRDRETRVAIKTLHPGYEESEKIKFMKEAILMKFVFETFVYSLISTQHAQNRCLWFSSPTDSSPSQLSLRDVLSMLIDVGRGCAYLESNRHVHRDLAARNCLISSKTPHHHRVTKIADFGLARGVHNSEHYKVRGEDFLPLRWLAPECISDGIFSSKSDVWAFGVLMYEIVALGQQPYPFMNNSQVLAHVRKGGTPAKPLYCPDQLYKIMLLCWVYDKDRRPSFSDILSMFEKLRDKIEFQDDKPYPPCCGHYNGAFDVSQDSTSSEQMELERSVSHQGYYDVERLSESSRFESLSQPPSFANSSRSQFVLPSNLSCDTTPPKKISFASDSEVSEEIHRNASQGSSRKNRASALLPSSSYEKQQRSRVSQITKKILHLKKGGHYYRRLQLFSGTEVIDR